MLGLGKTASIQPQGMLQPFPAVDDLRRTIAVPGYSLVTTVELDMFQSLFPELLVLYFSDLDWDIEQPYYVGGTSNITRSDPVASRSNRGLANSNVC